MRLRKMNIEVSEVYMAMQEFRSSSREQGLCAGTAIATAHAPEGPRRIQVEDTINS